MRAEWGRRHRRDGRVAASTATVLFSMVLLAPACGGGGNTLETAANTASSEVSAPGESTTSSALPDSNGTTRPIPGPPQTPATGPLRTPAPPRRTDPYLPAGVPDQVNPPGTEAYQLLRMGSCGPLLREIRDGKPPDIPSWAEGSVPPPLIALYSAAAEACLSQWTAAQADFQRIDMGAVCTFDAPDVASNSAASFKNEKECLQLRTKVRDWTAGLLKAHAADPKFVPKFPTP